VAVPVPEPLSPPVLVPVPPAEPPPLVPVPGLVEPDPPEEPEEPPPVVVGLRTGTLATGGAVGVIGALGTTVRATVTGRIAGVTARTAVVTGAGLLTATAGVG
jgi:hypothetical protein